MDNKESFTEYMQAIKQHYKNILGFVPTSVEAPWIAYYEKELSVEAAAYDALVKSDSKHLLKLWYKAYDITTI